eukprot:TRINITY_DN0_c3405_g1_i1.p1 TRINITY_DN0_c3405_g1~~TRINITY_DN0_c3405_g1_i1.p1  ORF type:complete len:104 (-),score=19.44 TRINITY_DN0_c3405_g1_i1:37-348(-)
MNKSYSPAGQWLLRNMGKGFILHNEKGDPKVQVPLKMTEYAFRMKPMRNPWTRTIVARMRHRRPPGDEKRLALKETIRRLDRAEVNFLCRYVLGTKNSKIPLV